MYVIDATDMAQDKKYCRQSSTEKCGFFGNDGLLHLALRQSASEHQRPVHDLLDRWVSTREGAVKGRLRLFLENDGTLRSSIKQRRDLEQI